jgi:hypothetical protein
MDSVTRFFASGFFHESVSPQPQSIPLRLFRIFLTPVANLPSVSTTPAEELPPVSTTPVANLPPVSTTPVANFATSVIDTYGKQWEQYQAADNLNELEGKNLYLC